MGSITSSNAIIMLGAKGLYNVPIQMQGFAADDIFDADAIDVAETSMGVDGKLSAGLIFTEVPWSINLQADSASNQFFDVLYGAERALGDKYFLNGTVVLKSIGTTWVMNNGVLKSYKPIAGAKKTLQPRKYIIVWESVSPSVRV